MLIKASCIGLSSNIRNNNWRVRSPGCLIGSGFAHAAFDSEKPVSFRLHPEMSVYIAARPFF
jgi:hypothetical protein